MNDTNDREKIVAEFDAIFERYEEASALEDFESAMKYAKELNDFIGTHHAILGLAEETAVEAKILADKASAAFAEMRRAEAQYEKSSREAEEAVRKYQDALLNLPPDSRERTSH